MKTLTSGKPRCNGLPCSFWAILEIHLSGDRIPFMKRTSILSSALTLHKPVSADWFCFHPLAGRIHFHNNAIATFHTI